MAGLIRKLTNSAVRTCKGYLTNEASLVLGAANSHCDTFGPCGANIRDAKNLGGMFGHVELLSDGSANLYNIM